MKYEATTNGISIEFNTDSIDKLFDRFRLNYEEFKHKLVEYKENNRTKFNYIPWDRICAIGYRLYDTVHYMNDKKYHVEKRGKAFDFYEFLNNAYIVIHCSETLAEILNFNEELKEIKSVNSCFIPYFEDVIDKKKSCTTDYECFQYIRSLCAVHPEDITKGSNRKFMNQTDIHCCPFVLWDDDCKDELLIYVYDSKKEPEEPIYRISFNSFVTYVDSWLKIADTVMLKYKDDE